MLVFYFFALLVIWLGVLSLRSGFGFSAYVRREIARPRQDFAPFASVIAPCRGLEDGLRENIASLFQQDYSAYEIIFVTDRADDPALGAIEEVRQSEGDEEYPVTKCLIAGPASDSGQKVHNLRAAISEIDNRSEVIVFVDTDARPNSQWLASLIAPLHDETIGAATGYRWFVPSGGGFGGLATHLRSVWNASIASTLGAGSDKNFCWGGSTAIRRSTFEKLGIVERWHGSVSDDFTLTRVLQEEGLPIHFVPACLVASVDHLTMKGLIEFSNRQLKITRVYASHLWKPLLIGSFLFCAVFFVGTAVVLARAFMGLDYGVPLGLLLVIYALGAAKAHIRLRAVALVLSDYEREIRNSWPAHLLLWPFSSLLFLCNAIAAAFSRRIKWRGITYDLKSPTEAVIIARDE
ncbi:MAG TPA: glycosyltransferase family 2 protein [Pyrinomonadaceae bacterium]|nr:glycosyltransferase family 2 protein [Pyrinomonadaceae bacterium]